MKSPSHEPSRVKTDRLLALNSALLALVVLNLALFDDLRVDSSAGVVETFTKPAHLSSILAVVVAIVLLRVRHRFAVRYAEVAAWIQIAAFTFFHGIPWQVGPSKPYWGQGMGDLLQWIGFVAILACSASIIVVARREGSGERERTEVSFG